MSRWVAVACLVAWCGSAGAEEKATLTQAQQVAQQVLQALGGEQAWNDTRFLRFDFAVEREGKEVARRAHTWDRWDGRYRLERTTDGLPSVVLMNVQTRTGDAFVAGRKLEGAERQKALDDAYGTWVNDTYWLLMPYKMRDPGVILKHAGTAGLNGQEYDKIHLAFEGVGLTPKDQYWAWVNTRTHLVDAWEFVLKGGSDPPALFEWSSWVRKGRILLASERRNPKTGMRIHFPVLEAPDSATDAAFTTP